MRDECNIQVSTKLAAYPLNRAIAWASFLLGVITGMVMGLWSFDGPVPTPAGLTRYGETSRRLLRLGHIAFFGLGYLNLLLAAELPTMPLDKKQKRRAAHWMNFGNVVLPILLIAAAAQPLFKYLLPIPASAIAIALAIAAWGAVRRVYVDPPLDQVTHLNVK
jgi:hypothetical protein